MTPGWFAATTFVAYLGRYLTAREGKGMSSMSRKMARLKQESADMIRHA